MNAHMHSNNTFAYINALTEMVNELKESLCYEDLLTIVDNMWVIYLV